MVGISLSLSAFEKERPEGVWGKIRDVYKTPEDLLRRLYRTGVRSVELRTVKKDTPPETVRHDFEMCRAFGMNVTVHGNLHRASTAVEDIFRPLELLLREKTADCLKITVHELLSPDETAEALLLLSDRAAKEDCKITVCLENGRLNPDKTMGETSARILDIVKKVDRENVKITWDFGHMWFAVKANGLGGREYLPDKEFIRRTAHTHIHGLRTSDGRTHFPPTAENVPLGEWMGALSFNEVYNFEPEPERWVDDEDPAGSLIRGVSAIVAAQPLRSAARESFSLNEEKIWRNAAKVLTAEGDGVALTGPSGYLFKLRRFRMAMDLALPRDIKGNWFSSAADRIGTLDFGFLTHGHVDHLDATVLAQFADKPTKWIVPEFVDVPMLPEKKIIRVKPGDTLDIEGISVTVFEGRHFRPGTQKGVPEVGYLFEVDGKRILFPGDTRNYDPDGFPDFGNVTAMFAHLWAGDGAAQSGEPTKELLGYANFVTSFSPRTVYISHLFESGREDANLWSYRAAGMAADEIRRRLPEAKIRIPEYGEIYSFDD